LILLSGQINAIFTDFEKAFDKVSHTLLRKLTDRVDDSPILWIKSFLCNSLLRVKINGFFSDWVDVISGIPQGTILGPILSIVYINDLPDMCKHFAKVCLFGDDAKLYKHVLTDEDHIALKNGLTILHSWSDKWLVRQT